MRKILALVFIILMSVYSLASASDQRIQYNERMVGANHPTYADTLNRLTLVEHNIDGTHSAITSSYTVTFGGVISKKFNSLFFTSQTGTSLASTIALAELNTGIAVIDSDVSVTSDITVTVPVFYLKGMTTISSGVSVTVLNFIEILSGCTLTGGGSINFVKQPTIGDYPVFGPNITVTGLGTVNQKWFSRPIPSTFFGIHIGKIESFSTPTITPWYHNELGYGAIRLWDTQTAWNCLEQAKGDWHWTRLDQYVDWAEANNVKVLLTLGQPPTWANPLNTLTCDDTTTGFVRAPYPALDIQDWRDYVTAVVTRYAGRIEAYEIQNEPNWTYNYLGTMAQLAEATREASTIIRSIDPAALVVSGSCAGSTGPACLDGMLAEGAGDYVDVIAVHLYVYPSEPESTITLANSFRKVMNKYGVGDKPMWNTETTWNTANGWDGKYYNAWNENTSIPRAILPQDQSASYLTRMYLSGIAAGIDRTYFYGLDYDWSAIRLIDLSNPTTGLWESGLEYKRLASWLTGSTFLSYQSKDSMHTLLFSDGQGKNFSIAWATDGGSFELPLKSDIALYSTMGGTAWTSDSMLNPSPTMFRLKNDNTPEMLKSLSEQGAIVTGENLVSNNTFADGTANWSGFDGSSPYVGDAPLGATPITFTVAGQYHGVKQYIKQAIPKGKYRMKAVFKADDSVAGEWYFRFQYGYDIGIASMDIITPTSGFTTVYKDIEITSDISKNMPLLRVELGTTLTASWHQITIAEISLTKTAGISDAVPIRTFYMAGYPTSGSFNVDDQIIFTSASTVRTYGLRLACTAKGTLGTLSGVTGTLVASSTSLITSATNSLSVGDHIIISGFQTDIVQKMSTTAYIVSYRTSTTYNGEPISYVTPSFIQTGTPSGGGTPLININGGRWPVNTSYLSASRYLSPHGNILRNSTGELGTEGWVTLSGSGIQSTRYGIGGRAIYMPSATEVYHETQMVWLDGSKYYFVGDFAFTTGLEYKITQVDANHINEFTVVDYTSITPISSLVTELATSNTTTTAYYRIYLKATGSENRYFWNLGVFNGVPGFVNNTQSEDFYYLFSRNTITDFLASTVTATNAVSAGSFTTGGAVTAGSASISGTVSASTVSAGTASFSTPLGVTSGGSGTNSSTGTGSLVLNTAPTLSAPNITGGNGGLFLYSGPSSSVTGTTGLTTLWTTTIPANSIGPNGYMQVDALVSHTSSTWTRTLIMRLNGTSVWSMSNTTMTGGVAQFLLFSMGTTTAQSGQQSGWGGIGLGAQTVPDYSFDTASDLSFSIEAQLGSEVDKFTLKKATVRIWK